VLGFVFIVLLFVIACYCQLFHFFTLFCKSVDCFLSIRKGMQQNRGWFTPRLSIARLIHNIKPARLFEFVFRAILTRKEGEYLLLCLICG